MASEVGNFIKFRTAGAFARILEAQNNTHFGNDDEGSDFADMLGAGGVETEEQVMDTSDDRSRRPVEVEEEKCFRWAQRVSREQKSEG